MSRSGYSDDCEQWDLIRWRGAVNSAIKGKRGQAFLRELLEALDAMPDKRLIEDSLQESAGVCALGSVGVKRGIDMSKVDPENRREVAKVFGIAPAMVAEIVFENDGDFEYRNLETPQARWFRMRQWVEAQIRTPTSNPSTETE